MREMSKPPPPLPGGVPPESVQTGDQVSSASIERDNIETPSDVQMLGFVWDHAQLMNMSCEESVPRVLR